MSKPEDISDSLWDQANKLAQFCSPGQFKHVTALTLARLAQSASAAAKAEERAACAAIADEFANETWAHEVAEIASAIRKRGQP